MNYDAQYLAPEASLSDESIREARSRAWGTNAAPVDVPEDLTGHFNTELTPEQESQFQTWAKENDRLRDLADYDMRGAWLSMQKGEAGQADNGHFPDTYKKPNHPTLSEESIYHGADGVMGGKWTQEDGKDVFTPGRMYTPEQADRLKRYFAEREPNAKLNLEGRIWTPHPKMSEVQRQQKMRRVSPTIAAFVGNDELFRKDKDKLEDIGKALDSVGGVFDEQDSWGNTDPESSTGNPELDAYVEGRANGFQEAGDTLSRGFQSGYTTAKQGGMYYDALSGSRAIDEGFKRESKQYDEEMEALKGGNDFLFDTAQLIGTVAGGLREGLTGGAVGGVMGAAAAITNVIPFAGQAISAGFGLGAATLGTLRIEAGLSYKELLEQGVPDDKAKVLAGCVGVANSLIEVALFSMLGAAAKPIIGKLSPYITKAAIKKVAAPGVGGVIRDFSKAIGTGVGAEVSTEVLQELVGIGAEEIGKQWSGKPPATVDEVTDRLWDIAYHTMLGTLGIAAIGLPGAAVRYGMRVAKANDMVTNFERVINTLQGMEATTKDPTSVASVVNAQAAQSGAPNVYINGETLQEVLNQNNITREELKKFAPELEAQLDEAIDNGGDVVISTGEFAVKMAQTNLGAALVPHVRVSEDGRSLAEEKAIRQEAAAAVKDIQQDIKDGKTISEARVERLAKKLGDDVATTVKDFGEEVYQKQLEGGASKEEARTQAAFAKAVMTNLAAQTGAPAAVLKFAAPRIVLGDEGNGQVLNQRVSTALPSQAAVKNGEYGDPRYFRQWADFREAMKNPKWLTAALDSLKSIPGINGSIGRNRKEKSQVEAIIRRMESNLEWLFNTMPAAERERARLWYDGGNKAIKAWAQRYGLRERQVAAIVAVFSPRTDWFNNMSYAERLLDIYFGYRHVKIDEEKVKYLENKNTEAKKARLDAMKKAAKKKGEPFTLTINDMPDAFNAKDFDGLSLDDVLDDSKREWMAPWIVKAINDTTFPRSHNILTPEGGVGGVAMTDDGKHELATSFGNNGFINKAISIIKDGSVDNISKQIGNEFKVRDFYNNLFDPSNLDAVTIDTHAVCAALLIPYAGESAPVTANFGKPANATSGQNGTYSIYFEAYRRAAEKCGVSPREMQSIVWEAVRVLFTDKQKKQTRPVVEKIWERHDKGEITLEQARAEVVEAVGGFDKLSWQDTPYNETFTETYDRTNTKLYDNIQQPEREPVLSLEVAPDPHDEAAKERWEILDSQARLEVMEEVLPGVIEKVAAKTGTRISEPHAQIGGWLGDVNHSVSVEVADGGDPMMVANILALVLRQDGVMVLSDNEYEGQQPSKVIRINLPDGYTDEQIADLYQNYLDKVVDEKSPTFIDEKDNKEKPNRLILGMSAVNGKLYTTVDAANIEQIERQLVALLEKHPDGIEYAVTDGFYAFPDGKKKKKKEGENNASDQANSGGVGTETWEDGNVARLRSETDKKVSAAIERAMGRQAKRESAIDGDRRGDGYSPRIPDSVLQRRAGKEPVIGTIKPDTVGSFFHYGTPIKGSTSVLGLHFSQVPRAQLDSSYYGKGLKGEERQRVMGRIEDRIYFYVPGKDGFKPEEGVGEQLHAIRLDNLYNMHEDPLGIRKAIREQVTEKWKKEWYAYKNWDSLTEEEQKASGVNPRGNPPSASDPADSGYTTNLIEEALVAAGFDGTYTPDTSLGMGVAVLLGPRRVNVDYRGPYARTEEEAQARQGMAAQAEIKPLSNGPRKRMWLSFTVSANGIKNMEQAVEAINARYGQEVVTFDRKDTAVIYPPELEDELKRVRDESNVLKQVHVAPSSLPADVAPGDALVAVHKIDEDNLEKALKLGGLPVPSIGITKQKTPYRGFGKIALIGTTKMVDPEEGADVYSADAYTVTFPELEKTQETSDFVDDYDRERRQLGMTWNGAVSAAVEAEDRSLLLEELHGDNVMRRWFLKEKGIPQNRASKVEIEHRYLPFVLDERIQKIVKHALEQRKKYGAMGAPRYDVAATYNKEISAEVIRVYKEAAKKPGGRFGRAIEFAIQHGKKVKEGALYDLVAQTIAYLKDENLAQASTEVDELIDQHQAEFDKWIEEKTERIGTYLPLKDGRLVAPTLENITEFMLDDAKANREKDAEGGPLFTIGGIRAHAAERFESLDHIKENRKKVVSPERERSRTEALQNKIKEAERALWQMADNSAGIDLPERQLLVALAKGSRTIADADAAESWIKDVLRDFLEEQGFANDLDQGIDKHTLDVVTDAVIALRDAATDYFEAKPPRAVHFNEFRGALVPEKVSPSVVEQLEAQGVEVATYNGTVKGYQTAFEELTTRLQAEHGDVLFQASDENNGFYNPGDNTLHLTPNADLSTFSHEMSHWFLEQSISLATSATCNPAFKADLDSMLQHYGLSGVEAWAAADWSVKERIHEQFAGHAEEYIATGQAPAPALKGFLVRLGKFIRDAYRVWKDGTSEAVRARYRQQFGEEMPDLSPEVKRVLDRMLVGAEAIEMRENESVLRPLFEDKPEGMSEQEWAGIQALYDEAGERALEAYMKAAGKDEKWYNNQRAKKMRENDLQAKLIRDQIKDQVTLEVNSRPEFAALDIISAGNKAGVTVNLKMNPEVLRGMGFNETQIAKLRAAGLIREGGVDPDFTREWLNPFARFSSTRKMIQALLHATDKEQIIEDETARRCIKEHSEVFDPAKVDALITDALKDDLRTRMMSHEVKYLTKSQQPARVIFEAAKQAARQFLNRTDINETRPAKYQALAARAGRNAMNAIAKRDYDQAAYYRRQQMVYQEIANLCAKFEKDMKSFKDLRKKIFSADKKLGKTHDVRIVAIARALLTRRGFGVTRKGAEVDADAWLEKVQAYDPDIYQGVADILARHPELQEGDVLTTGEMMSVIEDTKALMRIASSARKITLGNRTIDIDEAAGELARTADAANVKPYEMPTTQAATKATHRNRLLLSAKAYLTRVESWCLRMDGGKAGAFSNYIYRPIVNAAAKFRVMNVDYQKRLADILKQNAKRWESERDIVAKELGYTFRRKAELIGMLLHTGNPSNYRKMVLGAAGGRAWAVELDTKGPDGRPMLDDSPMRQFLNRAMSDGTITKEDMDAVQAIWDLLEDTKPLAQKAMMEYYGYYFEEVKAQEIETPWGTYRGGYVPAFADETRVAEAAGQKDRDLFSETDMAKIMPVTQPGFTHSRNEGVSRALSFNVADLGGHLNKVLKFAMLAPTVKQVQRVLHHPDVKSRIDALDPMWFEDMLEPWLRHAAAQSITDHAGRWGNFVNRCRSLAGASLMAGNISNALQQLTGFSIATTLVKPKHLAMAIGKVMRNPHEVSADVRAKSAFMEARMNDLGYEYANEISRYGKTIDVTKKDALWDWINSHAYILQTVMQNCVDLPTWVAAYDEGIAAGKSEEQAIQDADSIVRRTQSSFDPETVSNIETGHPLKRAMLVFYNYFNMQLNGLYESYTTKALRGQYGAFAMDVVLITWIPALLSELIVQAFSGFDTGDDDDWDAIDALQLLVSSEMKNVTALVPVLGQGINMAATRIAKGNNPAGEAMKFIFGDNPFNDRLVSVPVASLFENSAQGVSGAIKWACGGKVHPQTVVRNMTDLLTLTGIPVTALKKPLGYLAGWAADDIEPESGLDVVRGLISGKDVNEK